MAHGQGNALAVVIDADDPHPHSITDLDDVMGIFDEVVGELADVDQAIAVDSHVDEGAERCDPGKPELPCAMRR